MPYTSLPPTQPPARHQELQPPLSPNQKGRRHHSALGQGGERINGVRSPIPDPFLDAVGAAGCTQPLHLLSSGVWMLNIESLDVRHSLPFPSAALLCCPRWLGFPLARFVPQVVNWSLPGMITFPGEWDRNELTPACPPQPSSISPHPLFFSRRKKEVDILLDIWPTGTCQHSIVIHCYQIMFLLCILPNRSPVSEAEPSFSTIRRLRHPHSCEVMLLVGLSWIGLGLQYYGKKLIFLL